MSSSSNVNVLQWNREWFFSRRVKCDSGFNVMAVYETSRHGPEVVHSFTGNQKWVLRLWKRPIWFPKKVNKKLFFPWIGRCRIKVDVLNFWSPPRLLIRPSTIGKINSLCLRNILSFTLNLFEKISDDSIVSNSSRSSISTSPFQIPPA